DATQCHIWTFVIVGPHPFGCRLLDILEGIPVVLGQPFIANRAVKSLHVRVLLWLTGLDIFKPNTAAQSPRNNGRTEVFRAVVHAQWELVSHKQQVHSLDYDILRGVLPMTDRVQHTSYG